MARHRTPCGCDSIAYIDAVLSHDEWSLVSDWVGDPRVGRTLPVIERATADPSYGPCFGSDAVLTGAGKVGNAVDQGIKLPIERLLTEHRRVIEQVVGESGVAWGAIQTRGMAYGFGAGIDWHRDGTIYAGVAILYVHREWHRAMGGLLRVIPPCGREVEIEPVPNRMVLVRGGQRHQVTVWRDRQCARQTLNLSFLTRVGCFVVNYPWPPSIN